MRRLSEADLFDAILRRDFYSFGRKVFEILCPGQAFIPAWYIRAIAYQLERVRRGEIRRLIINIAPRSLKSIMASVAFPAFVLGHDPTQHFVCVSYSHELAYKLSNDFRTVLNSPWYRRIFPGTQIGSYKDSEAEIQLVTRGSRRATSTGGSLTGFGGRFVQIDDPIKPIDAQSDTKRTGVNDWLRSTVLSRLDDKRTGAIVIIMQRVHLDDLTGFVLRESGDWSILSLPAIAEQDDKIQISDTEFYYRRAGEVLSPEREPLEILEDLRRQMGSDLFSAQYQQAPVPPGGAMVKRHWLKRYTELPSPLNGITLQSWDTAAKGGPDNDYSVCTTWHMTNDCRMYLLDVWRGRLDYPSLKAKVEELATASPADKVLIEASGTAIALVDELRFRVRGIVGITPERDKVTRMSIASALIEAGQIFLPEHASWLAEFEAELLAFPGSRYDDQVDSVSQALNHAKSSSLWEWIKLGEMPDIRLSLR
jgi:predicted phage terminase large subunit-like protein